MYRSRTNRPRLKCMFVRLNSIYTQMGHLIYYRRLQSQLMPCSVDEQPEWYRLAVYKVRCLSSNNRGCIRYQGPGTASLHRSFSCLPKQHLSPSKEPPIYRPSLAKYPHVWGHRNGSKHIYPVCGSLVGHAAPRYDSRLFPHYCLYDPPL